MDFIVISHIENIEYKTEESFKRYVYHTHLIYIYIEQNNACNFAKDNEIQRDERYSSVDKINEVEISCH